VDDDNGDLRYSFSQVTASGAQPGFLPDSWLGTAQGKWWAEGWGKKSLGWTCPRAPEAPATSDRSKPFFKGTVDAAWQNNWFWPLRTPYEHRSGSYKENRWITSGMICSGKEQEDETVRRGGFRREAEMDQPSRIPTFADAVYDGDFAGPREDQLPPKDLYTGSVGQAGATGITEFTIPRHGERPRSVSTNYPTGQKLPGAVNVSFGDGHTEQVQLERLWQLEWHRDYVPPAKRPGLK